MVSEQASPMFKTTTNMVSEQASPMFEITYLIYATHSRGRHTLMGSQRKTGQNINSNMTIKE
ncbi:hypothetical protein CsSME_00028374 [Camellia sinensis var. sinensis]